MKFPDLLKKSFIAFFYVLTVAFLLKKCPFRLVSEIPCPACGMTRAYTALLRGDLEGAWKNHPLFWLVPLLWLWVCIEPESLPDHWRKVRLYTLGFCAFTFFAVWLMRI